MQSTTPSSVHCSGFSSEEAEDEDSDDAAPLNLSKRDCNRSVHTFNHKSDEEINSESESNDEDAPLDLCLRAQNNNQVQSGTTTSSEEVPEQVSQFQTPLSEQEQSERRHSAAFALCQLATSSNINTVELPAESHKDTQSLNYQQPALDQCPNGDTPETGKFEQNTAAQGQKRASDKATKTTSKRVRVNEPVRDKRRRTQNC